MNDTVQFKKIKDSLCLQFVLKNRIEWLLSKHNPKYEYQSYKESNRFIRQKLDPVVDKFIGDETFFEFAKKHLQ